jgi:hypothetical protein
MLKVKLGKSNAFQRDEMEHRKENKSSCGQKSRDDKTEGSKAIHHAVRPRKRNGTGATRRALTAARSAVPAGPAPPAINSVAQQRITRCRLVLARTRTATRLRSESRREGSCVRISRSLCVPRRTLLLARRRRRPCSSLGCRLPRTWGARRAATRRA